MPVGTRKSRRMRWLRATYAVPLLSVFRTDPRNIMFHDWIADLDDAAAGDVLIERWCDADPSPNGAAMQWLLRLTLDRGLAAGDLPAARATLEAYFACRDILPSEHGRLRDYETLDALRETILKSADPTIDPAIGQMQRADLPADSLPFDASDLQEDGFLPRPMISAA